MCAIDLDDSMPTLVIAEDYLFECLGQRFSPNQFDTLCFEFGIELDSVVNDQDGTQYKIDLPANRPDLFCPEGLCLALRIFLGKQPHPEYILDMNGLEEMRVPSIVQARPFIFCAILRDVTLTETGLENILRFQEKLHATIGRHRQLVSIGTHDCDPIQGPFIYKQLSPSEINFVPLNEEESLNGSKLKDKYSSDPKLGKYLDLLDNDHYPVVMDSEERVCSLPPIINGQLSRISTKTRNMLIEVTATDFVRGEAVLKTIAWLFSEYCSSKYSVVPVKTKYSVPVHTPTGSRDSWMLDMDDANFNVPVSMFEKIIGVRLGMDDLNRVLYRMMHRIEGQGDHIVVNPLPPRTDVLHPCDIVEDMAIGFGYGSIPKSLPKTFTIGHSFPLNHFSDLLRREMACLGFIEILSLTLCSSQENQLFVQNVASDAVSIANPKTREYQTVRTSLFPGLLKSLAFNQAHPLPIKIFEVGDVVVRDPDTSTGARNIRMLAGMYCGQESGFEIIHGCLDHLMKIMSVQRKHDGYTLKESRSPRFLPNQCADIFHTETKIGSIGVLHPDAVTGFGLHNMVTGFEISLESLLPLQLPQKRQ